MDIKEKEFIKESRKGSKEKAFDKRTEKRKKFVHCVGKVERKQLHKRKKVNPFAVCRTSTKYKGTTKSIGIREEFKSKKIPYRFHKRLRR